MSKDTPADPVAAARALLAQHDADQRAKADADAQAVLDAVAAFRAATAPAVEQLRAAAAALREALPADRLPGSMDAALAHVRNLDHLAMMSDQTEGQANLILSRNAKAAARAAGAEGAA